MLTGTVTTKPEIDTKKRKELSDFILTTFNAKKSCRYCFGYGIVVIPNHTRTQWQYLPCGCLKNK